MDKLINLTEERETNKAVENIPGEILLIFIDAQGSTPPLGNPLDIHRRPGINPSLGKSS